MTNEELLKEILVIDKVNTESIIENDELIRETVIERHKDGLATCKQEIIITKDEFLLCYKAWIEGKKI